MPYEVRWFLARGRGSSSSHALGSHLVDQGATQVRERVALKISVLRNESTCMAIIPGHWHVICAPFPLVSLQNTLAVSVIYHLQSVPLLSVRSIAERWTSSKGQFLHPCSYHFHAFPRVLPIKILVPLRVAPLLQKTTVFWYSWFSFSCFTKGQRYVGNRKR